MSLISDILPPANVLGNFDAIDRDALFEAAARLFEQDRQIPRKKVFDSLIEREKIGSTGLGNGIAIPHGRIKGLREATGAFIRLNAPIAFDAPDARPVGLFFILLVPAHATDLHLQILGELAQMFSDRRLRDNLQHESHPGKIHRLLSEWR